MTARLSLLHLLVIAVVAIACSQRAVTSPEAAGPFSNLAVISPGPVKVIDVGAPVQGVVTAADPRCDADPRSEAPDPCVRFRVRAEQNGVLAVTLTWDGPARLALWLGGSAPNQPGPTMHGDVALTAGDVVTFAVGLHAGAERQDFRLIVQWR